MEVDRDIAAARRIGDLQYCNEDIHQASFALPNDYRDLVAAGTGG